MKTLLEISEAYSAQSCYEGTDKQVVHGYLDHYEELLKPYRNTPDAKVVEVGICSGACLLMWREYFADATVWGIDKYDKRYGPARKANDDRLIFIHQEIEQFVAFDDVFEDNSLDVVIDDATHYVYDQFLSVLYFIQKLKPGGLLVVEDCPWSTIWHLFKGVSPHVQVIDNRGPGRHKLSVMVIIKKEGNYGG